MQTEPNSKTPPLRLPFPNITSVPTFSRIHDHSFPHDAFRSPPSNISLVTLKAKDGGGCRSHTNVTKMEGKGEEEAALKLEYSASYLDIVRRRWILEVF
ncbi:hypothetical protein NPIL_672141 [Nephila pilipes]|uniref:Uncharacterized protein n=1 Tax=Nephila pilipes TaxID=299642 RepID=A0A8X6TPA1_NEPPI|nr:hypothetical protein NPIL_672141 [Nephila pilipes]